MKNLIKSLAITVVAVMVLVLGAHRADASNVHFSFGLNVGVPVVAAPVYAPAPPVPVYAPAPVYVPAPAPVYHVEKVRCSDGYGYRPAYYSHWRGHRYYPYDRYRGNGAWYRGVERDNRGWDR